MSISRLFTSDPGITRYPEDPRDWSTTLRQMDDALERRITLDSTELTVAGGVVTASRSYHTVDTESDAGTDDLDTINGGVEGQILILRGQATARVVTVKDTTGNISLAGGADFVFSNRRDTLMLIYLSGSVAEWLELSRSDNQ